MIYRKERPNAKLNWESVEKIRLYYKEGATQGELARHYQVSINTIGQIVRRESWRNKEDI